LNPIFRGAHAVNRPRASVWPILVCLAALAILYGLTLGDGHPWGGDNAMYALHASNLAAGNAYADTGYIYNESSGRLPPSYPPVFPLLLAPWVAIFGFAWTPLKIATLATFIGGLGLLIATERPKMGPLEGPVLLALVGCNPILWSFKDNVLSEFPFLLFLCASLWVAEKARAADEAGRRRYGWGLCLGVSIYLAYGTRSIGALLLPALVATDLFRTGRIERRTGMAALAFLPLALLQNMLVHSEAGHLAYKLAHLDFSLPIQNLFVVYPGLFHDFWRGAPALEWLGAAVAITAAVLIAVGLAQRARNRELDLLDWYVSGSLLFFLLIRLDDMTPPQRYWIPLFPLFIVQLLRGVRGLFSGPATWVRPMRIPSLIAGFAAIALIAYASIFNGLEHESIPNGITSPDAQGLYGFVREKTDPDDTLIFFEPRVLTLYTERKASEFRVGGDREEWMRYAKSIGARYWVRPGGLPTSYRDSLSLVYSNDTFSVFRFDHYR
jgi:hypothetical protein